MSGKTVAEMITEINVELEQVQQFVATGDGLALTSAYSYMKDVQSRCQTVIDTLQSLRLERFSTLQG